MSARLFLLGATRFARRPSGPRIRHIWASSQRQNLAADIGIGGTSELPGPGTILGRICKLETDIASTNAITTSLSQSQDRTYRSQERIDSYLNWMVGFGIGSVLLALLGNMYKMSFYDPPRDRDMRSWVQDIVGNLESKMHQRLDQMDAKLDAILKTQKK
ncbi:hypothetical protein HOY80DRAFT_109536 [Tuber brumale]|nr:hypothetical protein HOY80DRAFT_109536 [Tuber brumale]